MGDIKIFGRWDISGIRVNDPGLADYINLKEVLVPRSHGRYEEKRFWKSKANIIERFMNKIFISGHKGKKHWRTSGRNVGKSHLVYKITKNVFENIEKKTGKNPIEVLVRAIENSAPREGIRFLAPFVRKPKDYVIRLAKKYKEMGFKIYKYEDSFSCFNHKSTKPCMDCIGCWDRITQFLIAGEEDTSYSKTNPKKYREIKTKILTAGFNEVARFYYNKSELTKKDYEKAKRMYGVDF
jgi:hypothetical protein